MSDEELLFAAAASAATISLTAASVVGRRKRAKRYWMRPLFQRRKCCMPTGSTSSYLSLRYFLNVKIMYEPSKQLRHTAQHRRHYHVTLRNAVIGCNTFAS